MNQVASKAICQKDIDEHAPVVFKLIKDHYKRVDNISNQIGFGNFAKQIISENSEMFGVLPNDRVEYEDGLLKNDVFKTNVIFHFLMSKAAGVKLSWEAYILLKSWMERMIGGDMDNDLSIDSNMIKLFNVPLELIPREFLVNSTKIDEFNKAGEMIFEEATKLKSYHEGFKSYDEYFNYARDVVEEIERKCHQQGFFGTHELERFTCLCISYKMRLPNFDIIYKVSNARKDMPFIETDNIKSIQEQILTRNFD